MGFCRRLHLPLKKQAFDVGKYANFMNPMGLPYHEVSQIFIHQHNAVVNGPQATSKDIHLCLVDFIRL